ncbi:MAG: MFS transporter, partial [Acidimicrobiales bacterium]
IIWGLTHSAAWVGFAGFAQLVPMALMGPLAGALADRHPRRRILMFTQSAQAVVSVGFMAAWWAGVRSPWAYVLISVAAGVTAGLNLPAWQAFVSELVPRELLFDAITLNSIQFNTARMIGPVLAGVTVGAAGPGWAFFINAASFGAVLVALARIDTPDTVPRPDGRIRPVRDFVETIAYVRARPGIATAVGTVALIGLFGLAIQTMSVVLSEEVFDRGAEGFGLMLTMIGAGAVLSAPLVGSLGGRLARSRIQGVALFVYGFAVLGIALAPVFWLALPALAMMGGAHLASASTLNTAIQLRVDEDRRAKVLALYLMALLLANPVGQLVLGQLIELFGPRAAFAASGGALVAAAFALTLSGRLAHLDDEGGSYEPRVAAEVHPTMPVPGRGYQPAPSPSTTRSSPSR